MITRSIVWAPSSEIQYIIDGNNGTETSDSNEIQNDTNSCQFRYPGRSPPSRAVELIMQNRFSGSCAKFVVLHRVLVVWVWHPPCQMYLPIIEMHINKMARFLAITFHISYVKTEFRVKMKVAWALWFEFF